jgi:hypothetical protein
MPSLGQHLCVYQRNPGNTDVYVCPVVAAQLVDTTPLTRTEEATINRRFARAKHYFLSMHNIERVCFTALDASINDTLKVSNDPAIQGWHASMRIINILDQLSTIYGQPTLAILETNHAVFQSPYSATDAPEVLFHQIEEYAEMVLLGHNPYTDQQLVTKATHLLITTGLYIRPFEECDCMTIPNQTWIALCTTI